MNKEELNLMWKMAEKMENKEELTPQEKKDVILMFLGKFIEQSEQVGDLAKEYGYDVIGLEMGIITESYKAMAKELRGGENDLWYNILQ